MTTAHYFIDVEAYGPPGTGDLFAIGIVRFSEDPRVIHGAQQHLVTHEHFAASAETMSWLMAQTPEVRAQTAGGEPFPVVWQKIQTFITEQQAATGSVAIVFWADDWSDFAWLDIACRRATLLPLRNYGSQIDSSAITRLAGKPEPSAEHLALFPDLVPHIALDDATQGVLELLAALHVLQRPLP